MPCDPAMAMLAGSAMAGGGVWINRGTKIAAVISSLLCGALVFLLVATRGLAYAGPYLPRLNAESRSLFVLDGSLIRPYIRGICLLSRAAGDGGSGNLIGAMSAGMLMGRQAYLGLALMMVLFFNAARLALIKLDRNLGSQALAEALLRSPDGKLIFDGQYYDFSSIIFCTNRTALLLNGRKQALEYGSYGPGTPPGLYQRCRTNP